MLCLSCLSWGRCGLLLNLLHSFGRLSRPGVGSTRAPPWRTKTINVQSEGTDIKTWGLLVKDGHVIVSVTTLPFRPGCRHPRYLPLPSRRAPLGKKGVVTKGVVPLDTDGSSSTQ